MSIKNSKDTIENRSRDLPVCSAVPQPTAPPRAPANWEDACTLLYFISICNAAAPTTTTKITNKTTFTNFQQMKQGLSTLCTFPSLFHLMSHTDILEFPSTVSFPFRFTSLWSVILHFHNPPSLFLSLSLCVHSS
jgi:hypothetical protein